MKILRKREFAFILALSLLLLMINLIPAAALDPQPEPPMQGGISVLVDGSPLVMDVAPVMEQGRTLVPLRAIFEALGAAVEWSEADQIITAKKGELAVKLQVGSKVAFKNGVPVSLDVPPQIYNDRALVPVRFISEALGAEVSWNGESQTVGIASSSLKPVNTLFPKLDGAHGSLLSERAESVEAGGTRIGTVLVLVNKGIYPDIQESIATYAADLAEEGYTALVYTVNGGDYKDLKSLIRDYYFTLILQSKLGTLGEEAFKYGTGVLLVGDLPVPLVHLRHGEYTDEKGVKHPYDGNFVCDLYLTDMDGSWDVLDSDGVPFLSTVDPNLIPPDSECTSDDFDSPHWKSLDKLGNGGARPEIWMGRLMPGPFVNKDKVKEAQVLKEYFARNHAYRHGHFPYVPPGQKGEDYAARDRLLYYDNDWADQAIIDNMIGAFNASWPAKIVGNSDSLYADPVNRYMNADTITKSWDYSQRLLNKRYLWVESLVHSNPWLHEFGRHTWNAGKNDWDWQSEGTVNSSDLSGKDLKALFYNLQGCDCADYRQDNNLGSTYLFSGEALAVLGNTVVGPHDTASLHQSLAYGANIGLAFMMNQRAHAHSDNWQPDYENAPTWMDPKRYYQQTLLGDPTLRPIPYIPKAEPLTIGRPDYAGLVRVQPGAVKIGDLTRLRDAVSGRILADQPDKRRVISKMPARGIDILKTDPGRMIIDPYWHNFTRLKIQPPDLPVKKSYSITLRPESSTINAGDYVTFEGILTVSPEISVTGAAAPVAGKEVTISEVILQDRADSRWNQVGTATTGADGKFYCRYKPSGSGTFVASYNGGDGQVLASSNNAAITVETIQAPPIKIFPQIPQVPQIPVRTR